MGEKKNNLVAKLYREIDKAKAERDSLLAENRNLLRVIQSMAMGWESRLALQGLQRQDEVIDELRGDEKREEAFCEPV